MGCQETDRLIINLTWNRRVIDPSDLKILISIALNNNVTSSRSSFSYGVTNVVGGGEVQSYKSSQFTGFRRKAAFY